MFCNGHYYLILEYFHHPRKKLPVSSHSQFPFFPHPLTNTNLLYVSMDLPLLGISYKWDQGMLFKRNVEDVMSVA